MKYIKLSYFIFILGILSSLFTFGLLYNFAFHIFLDFYKDQNFEFMRSLSEQSFNSMYAIMSKGWSRQELREFLAYLNQLNQNSNSKIYIYRNKVVDNQFGKLDENYQINADIEKIIKSVLQIKSVIESTNHFNFYYGKPLFAEKKCQKCHLVKEEDILGVIVVKNDLSENYKKFENKMNTTFLLLLLIPIASIFGLSYILVKILYNGIQKLKNYSQDIQSVADITKKNYFEVNFYFYEFNTLKEEFQSILKKIQKISIDKEVITTEMKILEKFIITSDVIQNWLEYIKNILENISLMLDFYFFYSVFKEAEQTIVVHIFHRFEENNKIKSLLIKEIQKQIQALNIFNENTEINYIFIRLTKIKEIQEINLINIETITKSFFLDKPLIGGAIGVGINLSKEEEEIKKLAFESLLASLVNILGSIKAINLYTKELEYYASRDPLTELYNQRVFWDFLNYEVERARKHNYPFCVIVIDLDNFKIINDTYGHDIGDQILKEIAKILRNTFRKEDILARYGGDEFVIISPYIEEKEIQTIIENFYTGLSKFFYKIDESQFVQVFVSIGISFYPYNAKDAKELFILADQAMFKAKEEGKNRFKFITHQGFIELEKKEKEIHIILMNLLKNKNVIPYYQPIFDNKKNTLYAFEVLMRIKESNEIITANKFIHYAEKMGIISELDLILLEKVLDKFQYSPYKFFFNLSPKSFLTTEYIQRTFNLIKKYNFNNLVFEITERESIKDLDIIKTIILDFKKLNVEFAIDDFGSGFSSHLYIKEIPVSYIKIEGNFIRAMLTNKVDSIFVKSIIEMSKILNIKTVAEFVENKFIYDAVKNIEIDLIQGNYIGKPVESIESFQ